MKENETCRKFVERIWGRLVTTKELDGLLWHCTAFPFVDVEMLEEQLKKVKLESSGDYNKAMEQAEESINKAMKAK